MDLKLSNEEVAASLLRVYATVSGDYSSQSFEQLSSDNQRPWLWLALHGNEMLEAREGLPLPVVGRDLAKGFLGQVGLSPSFDSLGARPLLAFEAVARHLLALMDGDDVVLHELEAQWREWAAKRIGTILEVA